MHVIDTLGGILYLQYVILTKHMTTQAILLDHRVFQQTNVSAHTQHVSPTAIASLVGERASTLRPRSISLLDTPRRHPRAPFGGYIRNSTPKQRTYLTEARGGYNQAFERAQCSTRSFRARETDTCTGRPHQSVKRHFFSTRNNNARKL